MDSIFNLKKNYSAGDIFFQFFFYILDWNGAIHQRSNTSFRNRNKSWYERIYFYYWLHLYYSCNILSIEHCSLLLSYDCVILTVFSLGYFSYDWWGSQQWKRYNRYPMRVWFHLISPLMKFILEKNYSKIGKSYPNFSKSFFFSKSIFFFKRYQNYNSFSKSFDMRFITHEWPVDSNSYHIITHMIIYNY